MTVGLAEADENDAKLRAWTQLGLKPETAPPSGMAGAVSFESRKHSDPARPQLQQAQAALRRATERKREREREDQSNGINTERPQQHEHPNLDRKLAIEG